MSVESGSKNWVCVSNPDGPDYFWNTESNETTWTEPCRIEQTVWKKVKDDQGNEYWWNISTNETAWSTPEDDQNNSNAKEYEKNNENCIVHIIQSSDAADSTKIENSGINKEKKIHCKGYTKRIGEITSVFPRDLPSTIKNTRGRFRNKARQPEKIKKSAFVKNGTKKLEYIYTAVQTRRESKSNNTMDTTRPIEDIEISTPYHVEHRVMVRFDEEKFRFSGVPSEWNNIAQQHFGLKLNTCPRVRVQGYDEKIPAVLLMLRKWLVNLNGFQTEGIFRIAPNSEECKFVKERINTGYGLSSIENCHDPHIAANLIKQFYREMKPNLLNCLSREIIMELADMNQDENFGPALNYMKEPERSAFLYLLDLMVEVVNFQEINLMSAKNLAIVISPNLFSSDIGCTPMETLVLSQKSATLVSNFLHWAIRTNRKESNSS